MLVLSRKEGESIKFRDLNVRVRVIQLKKSKVQLGIEAPRAIQVDRTETLGRYDGNEHSRGQQNLSRSSQKFDYTRVHANESESVQHLFDELAKLEVEVRTLAELANSNHQDLARQTALVSLKRLNGVRKMLRFACKKHSTSRTISDFIKVMNGQKRGTDSGDRSADVIARQECQEFARISEPQIDSLQQSGDGYVLEPDLPSFSEHRAL